MTGYVRDDVTDQISNGNIVDAIPLDGEFEAIQNAFASVGGHSHDGSVGEGAPITVVGPAQDVVVSVNSVTPKTDNTVDLGTPTLEFKDLYLDGTAKVDNLTVDEDAIVAGDLVVNGNTTLGNAATDKLTIVADVDSGITPFIDNTYDLGTPTDEWRNIYIDGVAQVDTLQVDESATIAANLTVNGNTTIGNATNDTLTLTARLASSIVPSIDNTVDLGSPTNEWKDLYIDGTANIDSLVAETATISAGTATLNAGAIISPTGGTLTLQRNDTAIVTGETLGEIDFQAPNVAGGGNATAVAATIRAVARDTFDSTINKTSLLFETASSGATATRMEIDGSGNVAVDTNTLYVDAVNNRVGIGTTTPRDALDLGSGWLAFNSNRGFNWYNGNSATLAQLAEFPQLTTESATVRLFRTTNTTGTKTVAFHRGNNTTVVDAQIGVDGANSYFASGNFGIGTSAPSQLLEVRGAAAKIRITDSDTAGTTGIEFVDSNGVVDAEIEVGNSSQYFAVKTGGTERVRVTPSDLQINVPVTGDAVTAGQRDLTAGRLLKVGDYGWGGQAPPATLTNELDTIFTNQRVRVQSASVATVNGPSGAGGGVCDTYGFGSANVYQEYREVVGSFRMYRRAFASGAWSPWVRVPNLIVGPITASGGVATAGGIIERDSNANGEYVRFADGTQIVQTDVTFPDTSSATGNLFWSSTDTSKTWAAAFSSTPYVYGFRAQNAGGPVFLSNGGSSSTTNTTFVGRAVRTATSASSVAMVICAIGRWF